MSDATTTIGARKGLESTTCSVEYYLEGLCGILPGRWDRIERRTSLDVVKRDLESYSELIGEIGWHAFRIVEATTTRKILSQNGQTHTSPPKD